MKKQKWLLLLSIVGAVFLGACSNQTDSSAANADENAETIIVGTGNAYQPFVYLDEDNNLQGYDVEVLKAVDEKLPEYTFKFESMDFKNILTSLSTGKIQLAAHNYAYNEERGKKYLYGEFAYNTYAHHIVNSDSAGAPYETLADLEGKKVFASPGSEVAYILETYNKEHNQAIEIVYNEASSEVLVKGLENGTADAAILTKFDTNKYNEQFNVQLQASDKAIKSAGIFFIFQQGDEQLKEAVDGALQELFDEGTLSQLSIDIFGDDYTK